MGIVLERSRLLAWLLVVTLTAPLAATAQPGGPATAQPGGETATFTGEQLEQLAAPIALYPDPLLAQVLMASTYPLEVVQAARFVKDNPNLKGDQLDEKLKDQTWDDSVKSLVVFPQVLALMDQKLDWVQKLGDAVLAQQKELLDAVQRLRARAQKEGNLKSTPEQTVTVEPAPAAPPPAGARAAAADRGGPAAAGPGHHDRAGQSPGCLRARLQSHGRLRGLAVPAVPAVLPLPARVRVRRRGALLRRGHGGGRGGLGQLQLGRRQRGRRHQQERELLEEREPVERRQPSAPRGHQQGQAGNRSEWKHNPENRRGVQYRDQGTQQKYNRGSNPQATQSREAFRGRAEQGRQDLGRGGADSRGGGSQGRDRAQTSRGGDRPRGGAGSRAQTRDGGGRDAGAAGGRDAGAFQGMSGGSDVRDASNRGQSSRQSIGASGGGGGARATGAGGGGRGGGGGGGGRGGGGGGRGGGGRR